VVVAAGAGPTGRKRGVVVDARAARILRGGDKGCRDEEKRERGLFLPARSRRVVEEKEDEEEEDLFLAPDSPRGRVGSAGEVGR
jgi:hypothetical protein